VLLGLRIGVMAAAAKEASEAPRSEPAMRVANG
jgi:hypothetical protein